MNASTPVSAAPILGALGLRAAFGMANGGGAWDGTRTYIEGGAHGGKRRLEAHKAAAVGDTVGDPFKDAAGPSMNILVKLTSIALVIAPVIARSLTT